MIIPFYRKKQMLHIDVFLKRLMLSMIGFEVSFCTGNATCEGQRFNRQHKVTGNTGKVTFGLNQIVHALKSALLVSTLSFDCLTNCGLRLLVCLSLE